MTSCDRCRGRCVISAESLTRLYRLRTHMRDGINDMQGALEGVDIGVDEQ